jgi:hypothetical protein
MVNKIKKELNKETGMLKVTGTIDDEQDFKPIHLYMERLRADIPRLEEETKSKEDALAKIEIDVFDGEVQKWIELAKKAQAIQNKEKLEKEIKENKEQIEYSKKAMAENEELDKEWVELQKVKQ